MLLVSAKVFSITNAVSNVTLHNQALGGPHTGMVKGFDSFFNNPALLAEYEPEFLAFKLSTNFKGDTLRILNLYFGGDLSLSDSAGFVDTLEQEGLTRLLIGLDVGGPISLGHIGNNWGWCIRNSSIVYVDLPHLLGVAQTLVREDLTFAAGISYPFDFHIKEGHRIELIPGIMSRATLRGEVQIDKDLISLISLLNDSSSILSDYPVIFSPMFAVDLGFLVKYNNFVSLSGVIKDLYTPILEYPVSDTSDVTSVFTSTSDTTGSIVYREINFCLAFDIPVGAIEYVVSDIDLYFSYFDLVQTEKNLMLHLGAGMDITLLDKFHLLTGFNEGLLALGLNVDLDGFDLGFAMYGTEEGSQPGMRPVINFIFSIGVSF